MGNNRASDRMFQAERTAVAGVVGREPVYIRSWMKVRVRSVESKREGGGRRRAQMEGLCSGRLTSVVRS